jgi:hypothetical protein
MQRDKQEDNSQTVTLPIRVWDTAEVLAEADQPVRPGITAPPMYAKQLGLE